MKKLAFFILLSLVTLGVSAQSNLKWNVNAGIGMSNWYGDDTDGTDAKFAYKVGIGLEVPFANGEFYQFNLSSCIRQQNSLTAQFVSFSLSNLANIFYPPQFLQ